jgi:hypothetical protein
MILQPDLVYYFFIPSESQADFAPHSAQKVDPTRSCVPHREHILPGLWGWPQRGQNFESPAGAPQSRQNAPFVAACGNGVGTRSCSGGCGTAALAFSGST